MVCSSMFDLTSPRVVFSSGASSVTVTWVATAAGFRSKSTTRVEFSSTPAARLVTPNPVASAVTP